MKSWGWLLLCILTVLASFYLWKKPNSSKNETPQSAESPGAPNQPPPNSFAQPPMGVPNRRNGPSPSDPSVNYPGAIDPSYRPPVGNENWGGNDPSPPPVPPPANPPPFENEPPEYFEGDSAPPPFEPPPQFEPPMPLDESGQGAPFVPPPPPPPVFEPEGDE